MHSGPSTAKGGLEPGDVVIVWEHPELINSASQFWWMGEVVRVERSTWVESSTGVERSTQVERLFSIG